MAKVGFGNPPEEHRFKPGRSGNPKGRPKGRKNLATIIHQACSQKVQVKDGNRTRMISKLEAVILQLTNKAASGDARAAKELLKLHQAVVPPLLALPDRSPQIIVNFVDAIDGKPAPKKL